MLNFLDVALPEPVTPVSSISATITLIVVAGSIFVIAICIILIILKNDNKRKK